MLTHCTLTGADDSVDPFALCQLSEAYPLVEWGVLWAGPEKEGRPRFPSMSWFQRLQAAAEYGTLPFHLSLHLCGRVEDEVAASPDADAALLRLGLRCDPIIFGRVQFNRALGKLLPGRRVLPDTFHRLAARLVRRGGEAIVQVAVPKIGWVVHVFEHGGTAVLLDRGRRAKSWPGMQEIAHLGLNLGYAGGIRPESLREDLGAIMEVTGGASVWTDQESSLRASRNRRDIFDLPAALLALQEASAWQEKRKRICPT
jgi:hypothetical protein